MTWLRNQKETSPVLVRLGLRKDTCKESNQRTEISLLLWHPACTQASRDQSICSTVHCCAASVAASTVPFRFGLAQPPLSVLRELFIRRLCEIGFTFCRDAVLLHQQNLRLLQQRLYWSCATSFGPRSSFIGTLCEFRFRRGTMLCASKRPSSTIRHCDCCNASAVHAICSGPRRPSFTGILCEFKLRRGTVLCDSRRPSFTNGFCNCCNVGAGLYLLEPEDPSTSDCVAVLYCATPKRPSVTKWALRLL